MKDGGILSTITVSSTSNIAVCTKTYLEYFKSNVV